MGVILSMSFFTFFSKKIIPDFPQIVTPKFLKKNFSDQRRIKPREYGYHGRYIINRFFHPFLYDKITPEKVKKISSLLENRSKSLPSESREPSADGGAKPHAFSPLQGQVSIL